jgi:hypothetical protein
MPRGARLDWRIFFRGYHRLRREKPTTKSFMGMLGDGCAGTYLTVTCPPRVYP